MGCETKMRCVLFLMGKWSSGCAVVSVVPQAHEQVVTAFLSELGMSCPLPLRPTTDLNPLPSPYLNGGTSTEDFCENMFYINYNLKCFLF